MAKAKKFGAFGGVFTPSILTILGVIMYLRLPWIVGQAGLFATLGIIVVAHIISASTGLSVASIATDKKVESGGTYYIISRSLGLPIGGTLGWALFVGLSFSVSLYLIGFAEVFLGYFGFEVTLNNIRIAGVIILLLVTILTFISTSLAIKTQYIIMTAMVLSLISVFLGKHNFVPAALQTGTLPDSLPWIALFAIFFPAVTGFEAGVSMSGDLKDPKRAIPRGTIAAIVVGFVTYIGLAGYFSATVDRRVLVDDPNVLFTISWVPQLVIAGILGATFSSALGSILSAPRILQAVAKDRIAPRFFSKGHGPSNEPRNAILLTFVIALGGILIGELNVIARVVTTFFIITYGFLNITYTVESWASSDFRPSFRIPRFVSIVGAVASIVVMIQLDILAMIAASIILLTLFLVLRRQELNLQSGDTWTSVWMSIVKHGLKKLTRSELHTRNWRPNVILMSGGVTARPHLIEMGLALVGHQGVFTNFELEHDAGSAPRPSEKVKVEKLKDYPEIITRKYQCSSIYEGIDMISRVYGFSGFEPDTILMGWPKATADPLRMTQLLDSLQQRDFNLALLDYDEVRGFGAYASVDFWWKGSGRELSLALHLMRFISSRKSWRKARLRLLILNEDATLTERYYGVLKQMADDYRLPAEVKVVMNLEKKAAVDCIAVESESADLTLLALPDREEEHSVRFIEHADALSSKLHSCLWIRASNRFETIEVLPETQPEPSRMMEEAAGEKVCTLLDVTNARRDARELTEFAEKMDADLEQLKSGLFTVLEHRRWAVADALHAGVGSPQQWLQLIDRQLKEELAFEEALAGRMVGAFLSTVKTTVDNLVQQLALKPGRNHTKAMEVAVRYYLYARRVDSVERFYNSFLLRTLHYTVSLREMLAQAQDEDRLEALKLAAQAHLRAMHFDLVTDMRKDIILLSQLLDSAKLSEMYPGMKKLVAQKEARLIELEEAPGRMRRFIQLQWNKAILDGLCLDTRDKVSAAIGQLTGEVNRVLKAGLYHSLSGLQVRLSDPQHRPVEAAEGEMPLVDSLFVQLNDRLRDIVADLPELITVPGNRLPEDLSIDKAGDSEELEINIRTTVDYYISNELVDQINKQAQLFGKGVQRVAVAVSNITKLATYHRSQFQAAASADTRVFDDLRQNVEKETADLEAIEATLKQEMEGALKRAFESLSAVEIVNAAGRPGARIVPRYQQRKAQRRLVQAIGDYRRRLIQALVALFYHQSKGVLWTKRQELTGERSLLYPGDVVKQYAGRHRLHSKVIDQLPYYYVNLFTDDAGASQEFRVVMQEETARGNRAIERFKEGNAGMVIVTGDRGSGKSSMARYLVETHFEKQDIWRVRPPLECSSDVKNFDDQLKAFAGGRGSLERRLDELSGKKVVLIDDLELWWERRRQGTQVIDRIVELMGMYGSRLLVVATVNRYALRVLEQLTPLTSWVGELIYCQPFNAGELKEMILTRHQAGGMRFVLDDQEEDDFSDWAYARYFNHLFNCTGGNPGAAAHCWLGGIRSVEGMRIRIERPVQEELHAVGYLTDSEWMVILQLVMHRRVSVGGLARSLNRDSERVGAAVRQLLRNGVLHETTTGVYMLEPFMEQALISNLKKLTYL